MKITALLENTTRRPDMLTEHGLSLYIETEKHKILFDMGQTDAFFKNAETLGIDLSAVDIAVLSHGHYDHGGGLKKFLKINRLAPVYMRRDAFLSFYNGNGKYIGLDTRLIKNPRLVFTDNGKEAFPIDENLTLYSCNDKPRIYGGNTFGLTEKIGDVFLPDRFRHEHYLQIENCGEARKRVLISGCSHKGIVNIMDWLDPDILIGGFHLSKMPLGDELSSIATKLNDHGTVYCTCHCTGEEQYEYMKKHIKDLRYLACGDTVEI